MSLNAKIVDVCRETKGITAKEVWAWACAEGGWKNPYGSGGGNGFIAWCASGASLRCYRAADGRLSLAFGQGMKLAFSRFKLGNASVPRISDDARRLGLIAKEPQPGHLVIVEVRHKDKDTGVLPAWAGRRSHIGIVIDLVKNKAGKVIAVRTAECNLGGRDVFGFKRPLVPGAAAHERCLEFVDLERYAEQLGLADLLPGGDVQPAVEAPVEEHDETDATDCFPLADPVFCEGYEFLAEVQGRGEPVHLEAIACDADGGYQCMEVLYGKLVGPIIESNQYVPIGCAHSEPADDEG